MSERPDASSNSGDDSGEVIWDERDWKDYLNRAESETTQFTEHYRGLPVGPSRLDETARLMGWETAEEASDLLPEGEETAASEPYTSLRHPVTIASRSLSTQLFNTYADIIHWNRTSPSLAWNFVNHIRLCERETLLALHSLDGGDFGLASCHLKEALSQVNHLFGLVSGENSELPDQEEAIIVECRRLLFDYREILLRVLRDSRTELSRRRHPEG